MNISRRLAVCMAFSLLSTIQLHADDEHASDQVFQDVIIVTFERPSKTNDSIHADAAPAITSDAAYLVSRLPGAALNNNGGLSGQVQYRGAYGARIGTRINHQSFHSGGPNLMDPPMHYAPPPLVETIEVSRGVSPVSFGPSLIGGVNTVLKQVDFGETSEFDAHYDLTAIGRSADSSQAFGGILGASNDRFKLSTSFSKEEGDDVRYPDGTIRNTLHDREVIGLAGAVRGDNMEVGVELRQQDTGPTGNPPFEMDIKYVKTDFANLHLSTATGDIKWTGTIGYSDVDHEMTNFEMRPAPASPMLYRLTKAYAKTVSAGVGAEFSDITMGFDHSNAEMGARITNPSNVDFFIDNLPDIETDRFGFYVEWTKPTDLLDMSMGVRIDHHDTQAGLATTGSAVPMMVNNLARAFNQSDRHWQSNTTDLVARTLKQTDVGMWRVSLARKTRAPGYLERFAWLPTKASAGLADGNNYVGDGELDEEVAWIFEAGLDVNKDKWWLRPTVYYHNVSDYIQGIAYDDSNANSPVEMVSSMNGDPTPLRFANVDAKMYGFDADYGFQLSDRWRIEGVLSVVRGKRRDVSDNLYRISPDHLSVGIIYEKPDWSVNLESVLVNKQNNVSTTNNEEKTSGHGVLNLFAHWQVKEGFLVSMGLENILDQQYQNHLGGYNRIRNSDVAMGERLPGAGRNVYLRLQFRN